MKFKTAWGAQARLSGAIFFGFVLVSALANYTIYRFSTSQTLATYRENLQSIVKLMAHSVDVAAHERLTDPKHAETEDYKRLIENLRKQAEDVPNLAFVYTLRNVDGAYHFVLDPTEPGDHDGDGVDDKSYLMDPYPEISTFARRTFELGRPQTDDGFVSDRWGTFLSAYAPLRDAQGRTVAILGVDRDMADVVEYLRRSESLAWLSFVICLGIGLIVSIGLSRRIVQGHGHGMGSRRATRIAPLRFAVMQILLAGLAIGILTTGLYGYFSSAEDEVRLAETLATSRSLEDVKGAVDNLAYSNPVEDHELLALERFVQHAGLSNLRADAQTLRQAVGTPKWRSALHDFSASVDELLDRHRASRDQIVSRIDERREHYLLILTISTLFSTCSMFLVWFAAAQQSRLIRTVQESNRLRESYEQVVEHLPVGLFQFRDGECVFSNWSFDHQTRRFQTETPTEAFQRALHPDDRERVFETLADHAAREEPFTVHFRMHEPGGKTEHYESRGVPVFGVNGELDHLLCFNLNITDIVTASQNLTRKNAEVEASNTRLRKALDDLEENFEAMVFSLVKAVEAKDPYTAGHSDRVMRYSMRIAEVLQLPPNELRVLKMGTLVHDIGKIGVPDAVLTKPAKLDPHEVELIKRHPGDGAEMVQGIPLFEACIPIIRWHHERLDGTGYPDGLREDAIPVLVRIAAVADCFDAMTSNRAYRAGMPAESALAELRKDAQIGRLDEKIVEILADIIREDGLIDHDDVPSAA